MKFKSKTLFLISAAIILVYAGCKKSSTTPVVISTTSPQVVASQLAVNLNESLNGGLGGFDIFEGLDGASSYGLRGAAGVDVPSNFALSRNQSVFTTRTRMKQILRATNPICGLVSDTTVNDTETLEGLTFSVAGEIKFTFNCTNNVLSGFTNFDKLSVTIGNADSTFSYKVNENVTIAALSPGASNTNISLNGTIGSTISYTIKSGATKGTGTAAFNYVFNTVVISPTAGIVSGSATFNTQCTGSVGTWNYSGTITFLGNGSAKITISGVTYNVNLTTGATS